MKQKVVRFLKKLLFFFPSKLPSGLTEFQAFADSIIDVYQLPKNDSFMGIISVQLMHMDCSKDYKWMQLFFNNAYCSKRRLYLEIRGAESRQTAGEVFRTLKEKQAAAQAATQKQAPVVTTPTVLNIVPTDGPKSTQKT